MWAFEQASGMLSYPNLPALAMFLYPGLLALTTSTRSELGEILVLRGKRPQEVFRLERKRPRMIRGLCTQK